MFIKRNGIFAKLGIAISVVLGTLTPSAHFANAKSAEKHPTPPAWVVRAVQEEGKRCRQWEPLFREFDLPVIFFTYIAYRESRCNSAAINAKWKNGKIVWTLNSNGTFDSGLLQINSGWRTVTKDVCGGGLELLLKPKCNVAVAKYLYENGGLRHWSFHV